MSNRLAPYAVFCELINRGTDDDVNEERIKLAR